MQEFTYSSDAPLVDASQDVFNRFPFAKRIAKVISNRQDAGSIVIGIYGAWGEGKTSVFNFIESELDQEEHVVCIRFNPWRFADENTMLLNFFNDLVRAIDRDLETTGEKLGEVINTYFKPVAQFFGKGENVDAVSNILSSADIDEIKSRVEKILEEEKKRVVVFIDDIDRLEKSEIHAVFRMVKLTADFKYTAYILAFDKEMVSASLQERYGAVNSQAGRLFLEKIIQVPLQLPIIDKLDLENFLYKSIDSALKTAEIELNEKEIRSFTENIEGIESQIKTPRQAMLYSNTIMFSLPILRGEVNYVDLMLIEAIRVFIPDLYNLIRENKSIFLHQNVSSIENEKITEIETRKKLVDAALSSVNEINIKNLKKTLFYLFPKLEELYRYPSVIEKVELVWEENQRICSDKYFHRFFTYSITATDFSDIKLNTFLSDIKKNSLVQNKLNIKKAINEKNVKKFLIELNKKINALNDIETLEKLALTISVTGDLYPKNTKWNKFSNNFSYAARLNWNIICKLDTLENKFNLASEIIKNAYPLSFAVENLKSFKINKDLYTEGLSEDNLNELKNIIVNKIANEFENDSSLKLRDYRGILNNNYWFEGDDSSVIIEEVLKIKPSYAIHIIKECIEYREYIASLKGIVIEGSHVDKFVYNEITGVINSKDLITAIKKVYIHIQEDEQFPESLNCTYEEKIARQFIWLDNNQW